ncbi:MAG: hypothetical protein WC878_01685 [Candidatus Paceibacterota bacterium]|jgi:hypothetical protein
MEQPPEKNKRVERLNEMPEKWRLLRAEILENFEGKTDGLNIERVKDFMKERNIPIEDFIVFYDEDIPEINKILGGVYDIGEMVEHEASGVYVSELRTVFVRRNHNREDVFEEGTIVHELSHALNGYPQYLSRKKTLTNPRSGFLLKINKNFGWGDFLEEGFAELLTGEYLSQYVPEEIEARRETILMKSGIHINDNDIAVLPANGSKSEVFTKYIRIDKNNDLGVSKSAIAATSLEMLFKKEPKLRQTLIEARGNIEKLREIPKLINNIQPGLYVKIQKCEPTDSDFMRVQNIIKEAIQNS